MGRGPARALLGDCARAHAGAAARGTGRRRDRAIEDRAEYSRRWSPIWRTAGHGRAISYLIDGLRMLPASAAIRTVLIDEGEPGLAALTRLSASTLRRVLAAMAAHDAAIVAGTPADPGHSRRHRPRGDEPRVRRLAGQPRSGGRGRNGTPCRLVARAPVASLASPELPGGDVTAADSGDCRARGMGGRDADGSAAARNRRAGSAIGTTTPRSVGHAAPVSSCVAVAS